MERRERKYERLASVPNNSATIWLSTKILVHSFSKDLEEMVHNAKRVIGKLTAKLTEFKTQHSNKKHMEML